MILTPIIMYILTGILWSLFATRMQFKVNKGAQWWKGFLITPILNFLLWPIAMVVAIIVCPVNEIKENK